MVFLSFTPFLSLFHTHLIGTDLPVDICVLADTVLQVRDVRLQPRPTTYDGSSFQGEAAFCSSPPETQTFIHRAGQARAAVNMTTPLNSNCYSHCNML